MGIAEIVTATLAVMGGITGGSAIMGAVMGSHRKIGSVRGFFWGLMFPVLGIGRVIISDRLQTAEQAAEARKTGGSQMKESARRSAGERFAEANPNTETENVVPTQRVEQQQQQTQSHGRRI